MGEAYWRYNDTRQQQQPLPSVPLKRPRSDYDIPTGHDLPGYYAREDERVSYRVAGDTDSIGASYDRYLRSGQIAAYGGGEPGRSVGGGSIGGAKPIQYSSYSGGKPEPSTPPDASNTLYVEGLPANCTRREVSHIFRPFIGFKEVRLVNKEARHSGDPLVLCFVDFANPSQAATALDALQGYKFDEHERESANIKLQFARHAGPRTGGGGGGRGGGRPRGGRR